MVGYVLQNTLTENGTVSRGICQIGEDGYLLDVTERTAIRPAGEVALYCEDGKDVAIPLDSIASMNCWGFTPDIFEGVMAGFVRFLEKVDENPLKCEYYLPFAVKEQMEAGRCTVKVYESDSPWYGVTYLEDKEKCENVMKNRIQNLNNIGDATVSIGAYAYSAYCLLPIVCKEFSLRYPGVKLTLDMGSIGMVDNLSEKLRRNSIDVTFNYAYDKQTQSAIPFVTERLLFAMHRSVLSGDGLTPYILTRGEVTSGNIPEDKLIRDMSLLSKIPFFDYATFSNTRQKINAILGEYKHCNHRIENARSVDMQYRLMCQGIGAVLTSDLHVKDLMFDRDDIIYIAPDSDEAVRTLYFVTNKDKPVTPAVECFIEVARELFS